MFGTFSFVLDSPCELPVRVFAQRLRCSVDSAKRWLRSHSAKDCARVCRSGSGRWFVELPKGDYSILRCRLKRQLDKLFERKPAAGKSVSLFERANAAKGDAMKGAWLRWDIDDLMKQGSLEVDPEAAVSRGQPVGRKGALIAGRLLEVEDNMLLAVIAPWVLLRAAVGLRETGQSLTVRSLVNCLQISQASLYRKPFGKKLVKRAIDWAQFGSDSTNPDWVGMSVVFQSDMNIRSQGKRTYQDRKPTRDRQRRIQARHFLCWHASESPEGRQAALALIPETEVDLQFRPNYPKKPLKQPLPKYTSEDLATIFNWLEKNAVVERLRVGAVSAVGDGYVWHLNDGWLKGQAASWKRAASGLIRAFQSVKLQRKIEVLNPMKDGLYEVPTYWCR